MQFVCFFEAVVRAVGVARDVFGNVALFALSSFFVIEVLNLAGSDVDLKGLSCVSHDATHV